MALTYKQKLTIIKDQAAAALPALLTGAGVADFDNYKIGTPNNAEARQFAVYLDQTRNSDDKNDFNVLIQAQLYNIIPEDSYVYQQIINDFIAAFDPSLIEEDHRGEILGDNWPINENSSTIIIFSTRFETDVDDCNYNES